MLSWASHLEPSATSHPPTCPVRGSDEGRRGPARSGPGSEPVHGVASGRETDQRTAGKDRAHPGRHRHRCTDGHGLSDPPPKRRPHQPTDPRTAVAVHAPRTRRLVSGPVRTRDQHARRRSIARSAPGSPIRPPPRARLPRQPPRLLPASPKVGWAVSAVLVAGGVDGPPNTPPWVGRSPWDPARRRGGGWSSVRPPRVGGAVTRASLPRWSGARPRGTCSRFSSYVKERSGDRPVGTPTDRKSVV